MDYPMDLYFNGTTSDDSNITNWESGEVDVPYSRDDLVIGNFFEKTLGLFFCIAILTSTIYASHRYTVGEREELEEAERRRIAEEEKKEQEIQTRRSKIAKIIESYAIHLTRIRTTVLSPSRHNDRNVVVPEEVPNNVPDDIPDDIPDNVAENSTSSRQIISGSDDESSVKCDSDEEAIDDIEAAMQIDNDNNEIVDSESRSPCETMSTAIDMENQSQDEEPQTQTSSSTTCPNTITKEILLEAVIEDPCAICLEPFGPGDDIVCCSNNVDGKKPHIFHKACSFDYIINHTEGMQAPCPTCRKLLLPTKKQRKGCFKNIHTQTLTLPELIESDEFGSTVESNAPTTD